MMLFAILFSFIFNLGVSNQESLVVDEVYHIVHIQGTILNKTNNVVLQRGMKINSNDKVVFKTKDAKAVVLGTKRGRFVLAPKQATAGSEFVAFVNDVVSPLKTNSKLSTRGIEDAEEIIDFKDYFGDAEFAIIGDNLSLKVNTAKYPLEDSKFFVFRYVYNGKVVNKKIGFSGNAITLKKDALFKVNEQDVPVQEIEKVQIFYYTASPKSSTELVAFKPVFVNESDLKIEFEELAGILEKDNLAEEAKQEEFFKFVNDVYGRTDKKVLQSWLKSNNF